MKKTRNYRIMAFAIFVAIAVNPAKAQIDSLKSWLALSPAARPPLEALPFSKEALTKNEAITALTLLFEDKQQKMLEDYGTQWGDRLITYGDFQMPFQYQIFGSKPSDGRSLFISLHGGGHAPAQINDGQYTNQKILYDATMASLEGVYLAPRAPTNTWDCWHQHQVDEFLNIIIQLAVIKESVNPDKVYIMGYSAGGDGVYQLAPRMADRWAAASMMAGHPNETSPLGLRNTPFALHMGALDSMHNRNGVAKKWRFYLDSLQANDPKGYIHDVQIHPDVGHWMYFKDSIALPWMTNYQRNPVPEKVVWKQDNRHHSGFYWISIPEDKIVTGGEILAAYDKSSNEMNVIKNYSEIIHLWMNDEMLDMNSPITIKYQGKVIHRGMFHRTIWSLYKSLSAKGDKNLAFSGEVMIRDNQTVSEFD